MKKNKLKFSVVIPVWRGKKMLEKNLPAVLAIGADEVLVVDASPENDGDYVRKFFPKVKVIDFKENPGFGSNVNLGVKKSEGDVVLLLNQDVKPGKDVLKILEQDFQDSLLFGVSFAEQKYGPSKMVFKDGFLGHEPILPLPKKIYATMWISGGSSAVRKKFWEELGGFDKVYDPGYWEDVDLSYRAQKKGWKVLWDPRISVFHESESSFGGKHYDQVYKSRIQERNHLIFNWKFLKLEQWPLHLFNLLKRIFLHPGYLRVVFLAKRKLFLGV